MKNKNQGLLARLRPAHRDDRGVYEMELLGLFPLFVMVVVFAFQLAAIGGALNMAENAARTGARVAGTGGSGRAAAMGALDPQMAPHARVQTRGETVTVIIDVPVVIPRVDLTAVTIRRSATFPDTRVW